MATNDSEDEVEGIDDLDFEVHSSDAEDVNDEDMLEADGEADDGTEGDDESHSEDSEDDADEDEDDEDEDPSGSASVAPPTPVLINGPQEIRTHPIVTKGQLTGPSDIKFSVPQPVKPQRSLSPAYLRRNTFQPAVKNPKSYTVEAICAIAHPEPTHALAASKCMSHVLTGSQDGYVRDYDLFSALNGKIFLTAPQRHHCNVVEGTMKSGQLRTWWENPADAANALNPVEELLLSPVYSLLIQSDALWALAGSELGHINLFTVRHDPGRFIHMLHGHRGPVSSLSMGHDEKAFFSAGWDGDVYHWDLNTGQRVRKFFSHGAQVTCVAVRPYSVWIPPPPEADAASNPSAQAIHKSDSTTKKSDPGDEDAKSEASYDPLFDDESDAGGEVDNANGFATMPTRSSHTSPLPGSQTAARGNVIVSSSKTSATPPRGPVPLDPVNYATFSPDILMTASIDGQVVLWDRRVDAPGRGVGRLDMSDKTPPWCVSACWSVDGGQIYVGRRNGTVDVWDTRQFGRAAGGTPRLLRTIRNPVSSGAVSCVVAFPDGNHVACASNDNIRLWNVNDAENDAPGKTKSGVPFKIIPGHHGGQVSQMLVDSGSRFLISASSNRGWQGDSTKTVLIHDIKHVQ